MKWLAAFQTFPIYYLLALSTCLVSANKYTTENIDEGCHQLSNTSKIDPPPGNYKLSELTPYKCVVMCAAGNSKLASLTNGEVCVCLNTIAGSSSSCDQNCTGDTSLNCGGLTSFRVYNISTLLRNEPTLQFSAPTFLQQAQYRAQHNSVYEYQYQLAPKSIGLLDEKNSNLQFGNFYSYTFTAFGSDVKVMVIAVGKFRQEFQKTVEVKANLTVADIKCPRYVTVGFPIECSGRLDIGKEVNLTWLSDGLPDGNMSLADPVSWYIGDPVPRWNILNLGVDPPNGLVISLTTGVTHSVIVYAWEMTANKSGTIDIVVLRPSCGIGEVYCPTTQSCCQENHGFSSELCNAETSFCGTTSVGINSNNCTSSDVNNPVPLFSTYKMVYNGTFDVEVGYNIKVLTQNDRFEYLPGDIVGWIKTLSSATLAVDSSHGEFSVLETVTSVPTNDITLTANQQSAKQVGTILIAGVALKPNEFILSTTAPGTPGKKYVSITHQTNEEIISTTRSVYALHSIGNVSFTSASNSCAIYGPLGEAFNVSIEIPGGTNATVTWKVNNISVESFPYQTLGNLENITWKQNFTFSNLGEYPLIILVANGVSGKLLTANIVIQEKIIGLTLGKADADKTVYQGFGTLLRVNIIAGTNVTYKWYFGDGSDIITTTNTTIKHAYPKFGMINTTVEATNMVSSLNYSYMINVSNPVEITIPSFGVRNVSTNITCELTDNLLDSYVIVVQIDKTSYVSTNCNTIHHVFTAGYYDIYCYIHVGVVLLSSNTTLYVLEHITGLSILETPPLILHANFRVEANITAGNNVSYLWQVGNWSKVSLSSSMLIPFNKSGQIKLTVKASNAVSMKYAETNVTVQEQIGKLNINSSSNPAKTDSVIVFHINPTTGSEVNYTVNSNSNHFTKKLGFSAQFNYEFPNEGTYVIHIFASNLISKANTTYTIAVQEPIVRLPQITCPSFLENNRCVVPTNTPKKFTAEIPYATNTTFVWTRGDQGSKITDASPSETLTSNITSFQRYSFPQVKKFKVSVIAKNDVSNRSNCMHVETLDNVTGFSFKVPKAVAVNKYFNVNTTISRGSNVTYSFKDSVKRKENWTVGEVTANWTYPEIGVYLIKGEASNLVSSDHYSIYMTVQEEITSVELSSISAVETGKSTDITWNVTGGTNVTSNVSFGDGNSTLVSYTQCIHKISTSTYSCKRSHTWNAPSDSNGYEVIIEANNLLTTTKNARTRVIVQDPVREFSVTVNQPSDEYYYVRKEITFNFMSKGSDVTYKILLDEDGRKEITSDPTHAVKYYKKNKYKPAFEAYNNISTSEKIYIKEVYIDVKIPPEPVKIENLKISAKPVKLNEVTIFEVTYDEGALFKCSIDFGNGPIKYGKSDEDIIGIKNKYKKPGEFDVTLECKNNKGEAKATTKVFVQIPIGGFKLIKTYENKKEYKVYKSEIYIKFLWINGTAMDVIAFAKDHQNVSAELNYADRSGRIVLHTDYFSSPGPYIIYVKASNLLSSTEYEELTVNVIEGIKGAELLVNPYVSVAYELRAYLSIEKGSDLQVTWNFGDGTPINTTKCVWKDSCHFDHTYHKVGQYVITGTAKNQLTNGTAIANVTIQNPIIGWEFADIGKEMTPSTVELKYNSSFLFPTDAKYKIIFNKTYKTGTLQKKFAKIGSVPEKYSFTKAGCYKVKVTMENLVSTVVMETVVKVRGTYDTAEITAKSLKEGYKEKKDTFPFEYPVMFSSNVDNDCLKTNWTISNSSHIIYTSKSKGFEQKFGSPGKYSITFIAYDNNKDRITATKDIVVDKSVTGLYFSSEGIGKANATVQFILLWATLGSQTEFTVDFNDSSNRKLDLQDKTKHFQDQHIKLPFDPTGLEGILFTHNFSRIGKYKIKVTEEITKQELTNHVTISKEPCKLPVITVVGGHQDATRPPQIPYGIEYSLFSTVEAKKCDGKDIKMDFEWSVFKADEFLLKTTKSSVIPPDENLRITTLEDTKQSTLTLPKTLEPGLKIFQLDAKFDGHDTKSQNIVYLKIQRPPLIAEIKGGSARSVPWNKKFELNATGSNDPVTGENSKLIFKWRCSKKNEKQEKGGCFGGGEELTEFNGEKKAGFREKLLLEGITYQFTVIVSAGKESTEKSFTQEINAIPGKPAQMELRCISNCWAKINPNARWSITSKCYDNCEGLRYNWILDNATSSQTSHDIWPNRTLTKKNSASLVVKAGTFKTKQEYIFKLEVTNDHDKTSFVSYEVATNSPPHSGDCDFTPKSGSSKTNFTFTCTNWTDDATSDVLWYKVFYSYGQKNSKPNLLYHGPMSTVSELLLPAASDENNNTLDLFIHVEDTFKAYASKNFTIKVVAANLNLAELKNKTEDFQTLLRSGDLQSANRLATALMAELCSPRNGTKREKEEREILCNNIVKSISTPEYFPKNLDSMRQSLETVITAVSLQENISESTQDETLDVCHKTAMKLKSEASEDRGNDVIEVISEGVARGVGKMFEVSAHTQANNRENNATISPEETKHIENNTKKGFDTLTAVSDSILKKKVADEEDVLVDTPKLKVTLRRASAKSMNGSFVAFSAEDNARINLPSAFNVTNLGGKDVVDVVGLHMNDNPFQTSNTSRFVDSGSVSLELKHTNGTLLKVQNLTDPLTIAVPRHVSENDSKPVNQTESKLNELVVHVLELNSQNNAFVVEVYPDDRKKSITIYCRRDGPPTFEKYDFNHTFEQNSTKHEYFLGDETIDGVKYYVGVASQEQGKVIQTNYTFKSYEIGCYFYNEEHKNWSTDGCTPSSGSTKKLVQCLCNHATLFGSNFFVAPNKLDVGAQIQNLANLLDYPALVATICVIGGLYLIGMIWALRNDRKKHCKATLHCAADNESYDSHRYEVTLFTGSRRNAGSTAEVSIIITGDDADSEPRLLQRTSSVSFKRTAQDSYLVTTANSLGSLQYIRIWHDNSGSDPSWFLSEVIIRDVETGEQYFFLCNSWLACDEGDGLVERLIPVAGPEELKDFQYLFMQNSTEGFSDGHLWFSIILRPAQSRFTHAQRITCCLCLLLCTMLVNAMFFKVPVAAENNVDVDVGPYSFTWHEVIVGIQSSFIVFPINLLIVTMFRRIAARPTSSSKYLQSSGKSSGKHKKASGIAISLGDIEMEKNKKKAQKRNQPDEIPVVETHTAGTRMRLFPWWFVFIAWFLVISVTLTAGFFTLLYGLQFGKRRQEQWLTALVISVFQDILVSQPIKIFALSLFVAFVIKKPNNIDVNEENDKLIQDEDWIQDSLNKANADGIVRTKTERKPPDELILRKMRLFREKERKMFGVFREIIQFFFFWWIALMIAYGYREPDAHLLSTSIEKTFVDLGGENKNFHFQRGQQKHDIYSIRNTKELLMWLREVILPGLYHEKWYNNMTDSRNHIISDGVGYLVGSPRLRLLRIKKDTCSIAKPFEGSFDGCESEYSFSHEYQEEYNSENWVPFNGSFEENEESSKWQYKTQSELYERPFIANLATYRGGGYVLKLSKKKNKALQQIEGLNDTWWIDGKTRAVFVEFTMFYPGKNLHCIVTILFECPASGGCSTSFQIQATRLDEFIGNYRIFVLVCELIFIISIAIFTYKAFKDIVKQGSRYWYQFWNWIEMSIIAVGWTCFAFYILRFIANKWTKSKFHDNKGNFVSFRYVATADQLYGIVLAFLVFLTSIKFLRLFRFNRRMSLLGSTLKYAAWDMFNFLVLFAVPFIACASVAYLLFQTNIDMFSSFLSSMEALLNIILGKFKYMNLSHDTFVASAVVLAVYCVVVVFVLMNVFLVILNDAFKVVKSNNDLQENDHEIVDYMSSRVKSWLGFRTKPSKAKSDFEHEYGFRPTYVPPMDKKYEVPATAILDRKLQELLDFVEKQALRDDMENTRIDEFEDDETKKKALLLLMS